MNPLRVRYNSSSDEEEVKKQHKIAKRSSMPTNLPLYESDDNAEKEALIIES